MKNIERCKEVLEMLIETLGLEDVDASNIDYDAPIFASSENSSLELDSVDALEIVVAIKSRYKIKMQDNEKSALKSVATIAEYIDEKLHSA